MPKCAELWINELRLTDFDERGGYAAKGQVKTRFADFEFDTAGNMSTVGFGSLNKVLLKEIRNNHVNMICFKCRTRKVIS